MKKIERKPSDHFKAKVQRILYPESNTISSDDDSQNNIEVSDQYEPSTERLAPRSELDNGAELFHRHEKFITKQVTAVRKLHQKGILAVSSKQRVDGLVEKEERPSEKGSGNVYHICKLADETSTVTLKMCDNDRSGPPGVHLSNEYCRISLILHSVIDYIDSVSLLPLAFIKYIFRILSIYDPRLPQTGKNKRRKMKKKRRREQEVTKIATKKPKPNK